MLRRASRHCTPPSRLAPDAERNRALALCECDLLLVEAPNAPAGWRHTDVCPWCVDPADRPCDRPAHGTGWRRTGTRLTRRRPHLRVEPVACAHAGCPAVARHDLGPCDELLDACCGCCLDFCE